MNLLASRFVVFRNNSIFKNDKGLNYDLQQGFSKTETDDVSDLTIDLNIEFEDHIDALKTYQFDKRISWTDVEDKGINFYSCSAIYGKGFW